MCNKFTGEHPCRSAISKKLPSNVIEITLWYGCSPVDLLHNFRTSFYKNTYGELLLNQTSQKSKYKTINRCIKKKGICKHFLYSKRNKKEKNHKTFKN